MAIQILFNRKYCSCELRLVTLLAFRGAGELLESRVALQFLGWREREKQTRTGPIPANVPSLSKRPRKTVRQLSVAKLQIETFYAGNERKILYSPSANKRPMKINGIYIELIY
ncbi:hypothetical protein PUN28_000570 [Cardiocondyla obscurior]|uniref:Uncharacterized protein n=1 Tax=Cardiocondyla obscurior TaxID=286306 RepID=A0AAW2H0I3_9HYME